MWLPEGTNINETDRMASSLADYIRGHERNRNGFYLHRSHAPRYYLSNVSFGPQSNYAQILVKCKTSKDSKITCATARLHSPEISRTPDKSEQIRA